MINGTLISPQTATVKTENSVQLPPTKTVHLEVRNALTGRAQEIKSACPVCGISKGWCYILPGNLEIGLYTQIICNRTPNPTKVEEAGLGEESLTIPKMEGGKFVYTNPKNPGAIPALVRIFKREVEIITQLKEKGQIPPPAEQRKKIKEYKAQQAKKKQQDTSTWLTEEDFDRQYRILARKFPLESHHKADLARRGFTEAQMKQYGFFSLYKGQLAPLGVSEYLPGFSRDYNTGKAKVANNLPQDGGYSVPYFNADGLVVGFQIRTSDSKKKYIWARGKNPSKLKRNEEDPISVLCNSKFSNPNSVLLMEGGLKAINCHERFQVNAIAASGGYFHNSKDQISDAINKHGINEIFLCPDAGDTVNSHVRSRWTAEAEWLKSTFPHVSVYFIWWGQADKLNHKDIDELSIEFLANNAKYLSLPQWLDLIRNNISSFKDLVRELVSEAHKENAKDEKSQGKGFGYNFEPQEIAGEDSYLWEPGTTPKLGFDPDSPVRKPNPTIIFENEHHKDLLLAISKQGGSVILNTSTTGSGKSMFTGNFDLEGTPWVKAFYISETHNNPTNDNIAQRFTNIAPRHSGGIQLAPGKFKYNVSQEELDEAPPEARVPANCSRVTEFNAYYKKGFSGESLSETPCASCPHLGLCRVAEGDGYGYFAQKIKAFQATTEYVRCDIRQLPKDMRFEDTIFFVDESDKQYHATRSTTVDYKELAAQFSQVSAESETVYADLKWLWKSVHHLFHEAEGDMYGIDHDSVAATFNNVPEKPQLRTLIGAVAKILCPKMDNILELPDGIGGNETAATVGADKLVKKHELHHIDWAKYIVSKFYREKVAPTFSEDQVRDVRKWYDWVGRNHYHRLRESNDRDRATRNYFLAEVAEKNLETLSSLTGLGLLHLLEYFYSRKGALRIEESAEKGRKLIITLPQLRYVEALKRADTVVLFDATMDIRTTKQIFQLPEASLYHIQEKLPSYDNLEVISVNIHGVGSSMITDCAKERLDAAIAEIKRREPEGSVDIIGRKRDGDEYYLFNHNRGSNVFFQKGTKTLVIKGTPWVHVGAMLDEFRALHGDCYDPEDENAFQTRFNEFYFHKVGAEIQQACGRLRHQWRPNEKLKVYLLTSKLDLNFLHKRYGVKVKHMEGIELTPFAGTKAQALIFRVLGVAKALFDQSGKTKLPNQKAIAEMVGVSQGRVSQIAEEYFARGWADLRRILLASLTDPYRETNNLERSSGSNFSIGDLDPSMTYFQEEIYKSRGDRQDRSEVWVPEGFDASIHFSTLAVALEDHQGEDLAPWTGVVERSYHPFDQGQAIAHLFANSSSGGESRSSQYEISYNEIEPFFKLIWGEESWFSEPIGLMEEAIA